jgi:hypothetical protein
MYAFNSDDLRVFWLSCDMLEWGVMLWSVLSGHNSHPSQLHVTFTPISLVKMGGFRLHLRSIMCNRYTQSYCFRNVNGAL